MNRTMCSACTSPNLEIFLDLGCSPIADAYTASRDEHSHTYPLQVAVCGKCCLVQLLEVLPAQLLFGTGYSFYSSASPPLSAYHQTYAHALIAGFADHARRGVVEIGCNDGDLLRNLTQFPHLGVDLSVGPATVAQQRGCDVLVEPFTHEVAQRIRAERGPQGLVIANHVLAHAEDVSDMLAGIAALMDDQSIAWVEVQYLPDLLVNNAFDLVYHEHRNFFSLTSLEAAATRHGLFAIDAQLTDRQGGSLRVALARTFQLGARTDRVDRLWRSERWLASFGAYEGMQGRAERIRDRLVDLLARQARPVAVYGAPAKATTLLNFCGLTAAELTWCVDSTPAKQGRHIPGTGIPILAPGHAPVRPSAYLLAAHNYAATIIGNNRGNRWIIPLPAPVIL